MYNAIKFRFNGAGVLNLNTYWFKGFETLLVQSCRNKRVS
jgi:hypothetical protein